jgi:hypothetical protein
VSEGENAVSIKRASVVFNDGAKDFLLDTFGKSTDSEGYVVEASDPSQRVLTPRGDEIPVSEFAGVRRGSTVFFKSDIVSLIEAAEAMT